MVWRPCAAFFCSWPEGVIGFTGCASLGLTSVFLSSIGFHSDRQEEDLIQPRIEKIWMQETQTHHHPVKQMEIPGLPTA
jgi:hypothetical protein